MGKKDDWKGTKNTDVEIISEFAREMNVPPEAAKDIINIFINVLRKVLWANLTVSIRRFGTFTLRERRRSTFLNKATDKYEKLALIRIVRFKAAISWRNEVNADLKEYNMRKLKEQRKIEKKIRELEDDFGLE